MPIQYVYQESAVLNEIAPELIQANLMADPIFDICPIREVNAAKVRWSRMDNYRGLMAVRGLDGAPPRVYRPGEQIFEELPGAFGEFVQLDESELTNRAAILSMAGAGTVAPMNVSDMVRSGQETLSVRQANRMREIMWLTVTTHGIYIPLPTGGVGYQSSYAGQSMTVATLWSNLTTATPLHDLRQLQLIYGRGTSNNFMGQAEAWMNSYTAQLILDNRNPNDVGGVRAEYGSTIFNSVEKFNAIALSQGAPQIRIYDESYQADLAPGADPTSNTYQMYIPNGIVLVVAKRPGNEKPGAFMYTRHMINGGGTKPYAFVADYTSDEGGRPAVPPRIEVHQGFNGGAVIERPSQLVTLQVA